MLGRLELGETETTNFTDPVSKEEIEITFRHATKGEIAASMGEVGLDWDDEGKLVGGGGNMTASGKLEDADVELARKCILTSTSKVTYRPALVLIGGYLREQSSVGPDEGEASGPPASGPTSES